MAGGKYVYVTKGSERPLYMRRRRRKKSKIPTRRKKKIGNALVNPNPYLSGTLINANVNIGLPPTKKVKLNYYEVLAMTSTSGLNSFYTFIINNMYDTNSSGTGHQPYGYDEWSNFYKQYEVTSATISVRFSHQNATGLANVIGGVAIDRNASISSVLNTRMEQSRCSQAGLLTTNTRETFTNTQTVVPKKFFKGQENDWQLVGSFDGGTLPEPVYAMIWLQSLDSGTTSGPVLVEVNITYNATLSDLVEFGGS